MSDGADIQPEDALDVAQRALKKANRVDDLEAEIDDLREELTAVQLRLSEIDDDRDYAALTLDEKVGMVREHGYQKAVDGHGSTTLTYDDVMWEVFDGEPGNNHCYKLIRKAAGLDDGEKTGSEVPGFIARDPDNGTYHLAIDAEAAKRTAAFSSRNNAAMEGGR